MVDPNEHELAAMIEAGTRAGEFIDRLGRTDMTDWSETEWQSFIGVVCGGLCRCANFPSGRGDGRNVARIEASPFVPGSAVDDLRAAWARASAVDRAIFFAEAAAEQANVRPAFKAQQFLAYFQRKKTRQP